MKKIVFKNALRGSYSVPATMVGSHLLKRCECCTKMTLQVVKTLDPKYSRLLQLLYGMHHSCNEHGPAPLRSLSDP